MSHPAHLVCSIALPFPQVNVLTQIIEYVHHSYGAIYQVTGFIAPSVTH